jgi:anti-anti-sigma factor
MVPLQISRKIIQESPRIVVLRIAGDVDYIQVPEVEGHFYELLKTDQPHHLLIDASALAFVVTPFLGSLLFWQEEVRKGGGRLVFFGLRLSLQRLMSVLRLERVLTLCNDFQSALDALPK